MKRFRRARAEIPARPVPLVFPLIPAMTPAIVVRRRATGWNHNYGEMQIGRVLPRECECQQLDSCLLLRPAAVFIAHGGRAYSFVREGEAST